MGDFGGHAVATTLGRGAKAVKRTIAADRVPIVKSAPKPQSGRGGGAFREIERIVSNIAPPAAGAPPRVKRETFRAMNIGAPARIPPGGRAGLEVAPFHLYARRTMDSKLDLDVGVVESCRQAATQIADRIAE
ncbi:MAG TPA: hypothetical protein VEW68_01185, partial [Patescibacteria group bacterium]|nr:hypothetical protein [Patescibacteria group bacterium]